MEKSKNFSLYVAPRVPMSFLKQIQPIRFSRLVSHSKHRNERGALLYRLKLNSYFFLQSFSFLKMSFTISNKNTKITYNKMQIFQKHVFFLLVLFKLLWGWGHPLDLFLYTPLISFFVIHCCLNFVSFIQLNKYYYVAMP